MINFSTASVAAQLNLVGLRADMQPHPRNSNLK